MGPSFGAIWRGCAVLRVLRRGEEGEQLPELVLTESGPGLMWSLIECRLLHRGGGALWDAQNLTQSRRDAESFWEQAMFEETFENQISGKIIGCAIEAHRGLEAGLLESAYEECLCYKLERANLKYAGQIPLPVIYKGVNLECYKMDIVVENSVIIELKAVERILPMHEAQLLSYLKIYNKKIGLLLNFHVATLKNGLKRIVNNL